VNPAYVFGPALDRDTPGERYVRGPRSAIWGRPSRPDDEACFCQFDGPSQAAVVEANRHARVAFDRILPASPTRPRPRRINDV
jgi:hypothetical protein